MTDKTVLHIGPGKANLTKMPKGFQDGSWREIRYDISPDVNPDIIGSITDMSVIETASVDAIYSSHNIEHVFEYEVPKVFAECLRVLRPDGFLALTCPDLETVGHFIAQRGFDTVMYLSSMGPIRPIDILYGHNGAIAGGAHYMAHRTGFSIKTLNQFASAAGFGTVLGRRRPSVYDLWMIATPKEISSEEITYLMDRFGGPKLLRAAAPAEAPAETIASPV